MFLTYSKLRLSQFALLGTRLIQHAKLRKIEENPGKEATSLVSADEKCPAHHRAFS
jgi:hypothetical protein